MKSWKFNVPVSEPWRFSIPFEAKFPSSYVTCLLLSYLDYKDEVFQLLQIVSHRSRGFVVQSLGMKALVSSPACPRLNSINDVQKIVSMVHGLSYTGKQKIVKAC